MQKHSGDNSSNPVAASMRKGRFSEALKLLQAQPTAISSRSSLLPDLLQRTGRNREAQRLALGVAKSSTTDDDSLARCHWTLANVSREFGDSSDALKHYQIAAKLADNNSELSCWIQLRLMAMVADIAGSHIAMARLPDVRRCLTRFGDARPFAALHLWIAEVETRSGHLDRAQRHLSIAQSLLEHSDDVWLQSYFAINSFGVSYYSAKMSDARKWAETALELVTISGHAATQRAAHANLGHIEFSLGHLSKAADYFESALRCAEKGSPNYLAILDSIAQTKLNLGELAECEAIINHLDTIAHRNNVAAEHYHAWSLQTKLQLLLKQGRIPEAAVLSAQIDGALSIISQPRLRAVLGLLSVETSLAQGHSEIAAFKLRSVFLNSSEFPPDLLAETERVVAKTLCASGLPGIGRTNLSRAIGTYEIIGHTIGKASAASDIDLFGSHIPHRIEPLSARTLLDRIRVLLETRRRPELFALEAAELLRDLDCAINVRIAPSEVKVRPIQTSDSPIVYSTVLTPNGPRLEFSPKRDSGSIVASLTFQRVVERIGCNEIDDRSDDILWPQSDTAVSDDMVFAADSMIEILKTVRKVATTNLSVLITGETGTGKEAVARALHERSQRINRPFTAFNCAAVPRELLEIQLFGYRRGAFSGATEPFEGVIRGANGGTLLLDEVGEIPLEMQPKLLRFLETGEIHPLGEAQPIKVDVRLILATNADLVELVAQRRFREDLLFRINVIHIEVPPLRERREEIPLLIDLFSRRFSRELARQQPRFGTETIEHLVFYDWPGNVRQLNNEVRRILALNDDDEILPDSLSQDIRQDRASTRSALDAGSSVTIRLNQNLSCAVEQIERAMLKHALEEANGRLTLAAEKLGLSRKGLYLKRRRLGLSDQ
jgi:DNA-binding NtrC family response regulator/tetratricopeptide (TPR) repeat protein